MSLLYGIVIICDTLYAYTIMNRQMLKNAMIIINIAVSSLYIFVPMLDKIQTYLGIDEYSFLWFLVLAFTNYIIYVFCAAGIILSIRFLIKNKIIFLKKYLFLIPSLIYTLFLVFFIIMFEIRKNEGWVISYSIIPAILMGIGSPALLFYYLNGNYKFHLSAILCFLFPLSTFIVGLFVYGLPRI